MLTAAIGIAVVLFAVTAVTAVPSLNTPLYTYRMEQTSNKMNFLPYKLNTYMYITEKGYYVNYGGFKITSDGGGTDSVINTCSGTGHTCNGAETCYSTCPYTCWITCWNTCLETCPHTCWETCYEPTCETCFITCHPGCLTAATQTC